MNCAFICNSLQTTTYDHSGNIMTLQRNGKKTDGTFGAIDNLTYTYNDDRRLALVADAADLAKGYKPGAGGYLYYDPNGNIIRDNARGILSIRYNHLNLPTRFNYSSNNFIEIIYDANGKKLRKITGNSANTSPFITKRYVDGIEYAGNNLEAIYHAEGRAIPSGTAFEYQYTLKDHLGNSRVMFRYNTTTTKAEILQENHYYPFGMEMETTVSTQIGTKNAYQYNGKELNADFGLNLMDYGARWYDAAIARFTTIDPLAEQQHPFGSYSYAANNPMRFIDYMGLAASDPVGVMRERGRVSENRSEATNRAAFWSGFVKDNFSTTASNQTSSGTTDTGSADKAVPNVYYVNATNSKNIDTKAIVNEAKNILNKNGIDVTFVPISIQKARSQRYWAYTDMFLAIVNQKTSEPGKSRIGEYGMVEGDGGYSNSETTPQGFASYVNYKTSEITSYKGNPIYAAGYIVAHEVLHQLLAKSGIAPNHTNLNPNLNQDGMQVTIPLNSSKSIREAERILPEHLTAINNYLQQRP